MCVPVSDSQVDIHHNSVCINHKHMDQVHPVVLLYRGAGASRAEGGLFGSSPGHLDHDTLDHASQCSSGSQREAAVQLSGS